MSTVEEKQKALNDTVASLGTAKFELDEATVSITKVIESPSSYILVDVRTEEERAVGIIPGAITQKEFESAPEKYADKEVVCYCTVGYISGGACKYLRNKVGDNKHTHAI